MRRLMSSTTIAIFVAILLVASVFAGTYRAPDKDTTCAVGGSCYDNYGVYLEGSGSPAGGCTSKYVGYIGWDLSSETRTWQSAVLKLWAYNTSGGGPTYTFTLYPANSDNWTVDGADPGYDSATVLATASADLSSASSNNMVEVVFTSDDLGDYFLNKKGQEATLAVVMTDGCGSVSGSVWFEDANGTGGTAPQSGNEPDLIFYTGGDATAVSVSSVNANSGPDWPMIAGLVALALAAVAGIGYGVRRFNS